MSNMQAIKLAVVLGFVCLVAGQAPAGPAGFGFGAFGPGPAGSAGPAGPVGPAGPGPALGHGLHGYHAPAHHVYPVHHAPAHHHDDHAVPTSYKFEYGVKDDHTHDHKSQQEHKDKAHHVTGSYELVEPDGSKRLVHYTSDEHLGFVAHVTKEGPYVHPHGAHSHHNFNLHV